MTWNDTVVNQARSLEPKTPYVVLLCVCVLAYRAAAWLKPSSFIEITPSLSLFINGLGLFILTCGLWVWLSRPSLLSQVFLVAAVGGAIHWGGAIGAEHEGLAIAFFTFYMAATALGDGAFLDFSLQYARTVRAPRALRAAFYLPAILTLAAAPVAPFLPRRVAETGIGMIIGMALLMSIAGGVVFLIKWVRATPGDRRAYALTPIVVALVATTALDLLADAGVLPGPRDAWSLTYALVPLTLSWALTHRAGSPSPPSRAGRSETG